MNLSTGSTRRSLVSALGLVVLALLAVAALWLTGCSANDPFDPNSVPNHPPSVRLFVAPVDPDTDLSPTSYFERNFQWSGTDPDGWVTDYFVSIRTETDVPAPWDTTTGTDTTMTFITDENGEAEATFLLVCRDNRGALSDTVRQFIPLKNFPPVVNFQSDYDPLVNMQREFLDADGNPTLDSEAAADTTYWNWGPCNFRLFALDLDGAATMDDHFRYTLVDTALGDPLTTWDVDDPAADPEAGWVRSPFVSLEEIQEFEIFVRNLTPDARKTLTVSVTDEANADTRFHYTWDVRAPKGALLYIPDNTSPRFGQPLYRGILTGEFGSDGYDVYDFWFGFPDRADILLETMRLFDAVMWTDGGATSAIMRKCAERDGVLQRYVLPVDGSAPGRFLLISKQITNSTAGLSAPFVQQVVGVSPTSSPQGEIMQPEGKQALPVFPHLPALTIEDDFASGSGLVPLAGTEILYRMEECPRCYNERRPPWDPIVAVRWPETAVDPLARAVTFSLQLEYYNAAEVGQALSQVFRVDLGVSAP